MDHPACCPGWPIGHEGALQRQADRTLTQSRTPPLLAGEARASFLGEGAGAFSGVF